eukprot:15431910-Alexandrium_andersonii.AAC.1
MCRAAWPAAVLRLLVLATVDMQGVRHPSLVGVGDMSHCPVHVTHEGARSQCQQHPEQQGEGEEREACAPAAPADSRLDRSGACEAHDRQGGGGHRAEGCGRGGATRRALRCRWSPARRARARSRTGARW